MSSTLPRGRLGEDLAAAHLESLGFEIIARNYRTRWGELDIIARRGILTVFAEVKLRRNADFAEAGASVGRAKQERLRRTALCFMAAHGEAESARFDVFEIYQDGDNKPALHHIENAF